MGIESGGNVSKFGGNWDCAEPELFSHGTGSNPDFGFNVVGVDNFSPHADFGSNNVNTIDFGRETGVKGSPILIDSVASTVPASEPDIQICQVIV